MKRALAVVVVIALSRTAWATEIPPLDAGSVSATAPLVVTGYVLDRKLVHELSGVAEYSATVQVLDVLRGDPALKQVRLRLRTSLVHFDLLVERGDSGVFFLKPSDDGAFEAAYPGSFALFQRGVVKPPAVADTAHPNRAPAGRASRAAPSGPSPAAARQAASVPALASQRSRPTGYSLHRPSQ